MADSRTSLDGHEQEIARLEERIRQLEERLADHKRSVLEHPIARVSLGISAATGPDFFKVLVCELARALQCDASMVASLKEDDSSSAETIAYCHQDQLVENEHFELAATPFEETIRSSFCYCNGDAQQRFPLDSRLKALGAKSYAGMPLLDTNGKPMGLVAVLSSRGLMERDVVEATLRITVSRAVAELERARAEQQRLTVLSQLRRQLAELSALYQSVPIGLAFIDHDLRYVTINEKLAQIGNRSVEAHRGRTVREVLPLIADDLEPKLRYVLETGNPIIEDEASGRISVDGRSDLVRLRTFCPVKDEQGQLLGVSVIVEDITERKRIEQSLRRSEEELRQRYAELSTIYRTAPIGLAYVDTEFRYRAISEQLAKIHGLPVNVHYGRRLVDLIPELGNTETEVMQRVLTTGEPIVDEEVRAQTPAYPGQVRIYRRSIIPVRSPDGSLLGLNIVVQDITEQKRAEEALRIHDHAMRSAVGGIALGDMEGRITWVNPAMEQMLGYSANELIGATGAMLVTNPQDLPGLTQEFYERGTWSGEFETRRKDGRLIYVMVHASVVRDATGQPICTMSWCEDVSAKKQFEAEREALIAQLETKNAELERFTYTVSHDLKSPLVTISGFVGMLDHDLAANDAAAVRDDLAEIHAATVRMKQLLDELLELSRIGRVMNPPQDVSLTDLALQVVRTVEATVPKVRFSVSPDLPVVRGDAPRLMEVLQNLIDNAVRFTSDSQEPFIEIGQRHDGNQRVIFVRDNGIGIEPQYLKRIFNLFEQLNPQAGGTGVGLAISKRIVEVHGGSIWAESDGLGKGATFCFTLPEVESLD